MKPQFRIVADGTDITRLINDRLLMLRTLDKPGMESDEFELRIDDRDQAVSLPSRGAKIEVFLGYDGAQLTRINSYTVDEIELTGPSDTLVIRGKASDMRGSGKTTRNGSFEDKTLAEIVATVARRNGWVPACDVQTVLPRADQLGESDYNFITRIARLHDCTAKVANGKLLVLKRQAGVTASGKTLGLFIEALLERRKLQGVRNSRLITNDSGLRMSWEMLRNRFSEAREKAARKLIADGNTDLATKVRQFQFRDIRPKAASEIEDISHASRLLGHSKEEITKRVYRRVGEVVSPTK